MKATILGFVCLSVVLLSTVGLCSCGDETGVSWNTGSYATDSGVDSPDGGNATEDGGNGGDNGGEEDKWKNWRLVIPGEYWRASDRENSTITIYLDQDPNIPCPGLLFGRLSPYGTVCLDSLQGSISLCKKNDAKCIDWIGDFGTGQIYLCDCNVLGEQFGAEIQSWCQELGHPQENCDTGGIRIHLTDSEKERIFFKE